MFEFHGWATIRFSAENRDRADEDALQDAAVEKVRTRIQQLGQHGWGQAPNPVLDLRVINGQAQLWTAGFKNRPAAIEEDLLGLFRYLADAAPGSYGLLYTLDGEDPGPYNNAFRVYVLARGALTEHTDPFLSPFVPVVEDSYSEG